MPDLTDLETAILAFEHLRWQQPGAKDAAIRDRFEVTPTRYYQLLRGLLGRPEALAHDPVVVNRLLRLRAQGARRRGVVRTGWRASDLYLFAT